MDFDFKVVTAKQESPNLRFLGRYTDDRPYSGIWINRRTSELCLNGDVLKGVPQDHIFVDAQYWIPHTDYISEKVYKKEYSSVQASYESFKEIGMQTTINTYRKHLKYGIDWHMLDIVCTLYVKSCEAPYFSDLLEVKNVSSDDVDKVIREMKTILWENNEKVFYEDSVFS